jgi:hypothetical protein
MLRYTNQGILHSVSNQFPYPPGDQRLRAIDRAYVNPLNRYTPFIKAVGPVGQDYGDPAMFILFGTGSGKNGRIVYVWTTLLSGPDGQAIMADIVTWILDATFRPPRPLLNTLPPPDSTRVVFGFAAVSNLDYLVQYRNSLGTGSWATLQEFRPAPMNRAASFTNTVTGIFSRFYRLLVGS